MHNVRMLWQFLGHIGVLAIFLYCSCNYNQLRNMYINLLFMYFERRCSSRENSTVHDCLI